MLHGSKVKVNPQRFIDKVYIMLDIMEVSPQEKVELASYQLKDVAQVWYIRWKRYKTVGAGPREWEVFKSTNSIDSFPESWGNLR